MTCRDALADFYVARVRLDEDGVRANAWTLCGHAGHAHRRLHQDGRADFFEYIMWPVYDSLSRAFRES